MNGGLAQADRVMRTVEAEMILTNSTGEGAGQGGQIIARCRQERCGHRWTVAHLPMPLETAARLMQRAACPCCGDERPFLGP